MAKHPFQKSFRIPEDGKATLEQISSLPIWDDRGSYDLFMNNLYGVDEIQKKIKAGEKFYLLEGAKEMSNDWKILVAGLSPKLYCMDFNAPFKLLDKEFHGVGDFTKYFMRGEIEIKRKWGSERNNTLHQRMLEDYVQLKSLGNGISVLNEDRVPKYLRRTLGL